MPDKSANRQRPSAPRANQVSKDAENSIPANVGTPMEEGTILKSGEATGPMESDKGTGPNKT